MCLSSVTGTKILKKDLEVFKIVLYNKKSRHYYISIYNHYQQNIKKGINNAKFIGKIGSCNLEYNSGYHCFLSCDAAVIYTLNYKQNIAKIRKFIVPKGTKITFGTQTVLILNKRRNNDIFITRKH